MSRFTLLVSLVLSVEVGCTAPLPASPPVSPQSVTIAEVARPTPNDAHHEVGLRVAIEPDAVLYVDGNRLHIGEDQSEVLHDLGPPRWTKDTPTDETAMSETTYLHYLDRGFAVRIKHGKAEGFYIQLEPAEIEGHHEVAAHVALPKGLTFGATVDQIVSSMGDPTRQHDLDFMHWMDFYYRVGSTSIDYHTEQGTLRSVAIEVPAADM